MGWLLVTDNIERKNAWHALREELQQALDARQRFRRQTFFDAPDSRRIEPRDRHVDCNDDKLIWTGPFDMTGTVSNRLEFRGPTARCPRPGYVHQA